MREAAKFLFEPIDHGSVADAVVEQIETLIVAGVLKEGSKLPSEREMAELFDVSRPKLREALKRLEDQNLIEVRHGEGSVIAPLIGKALSPALVDLYARHPVAFFDYLEYRREQESFAARLAAERATKADKEILTRIMADMVAAHEADDSEAAQRADIGLHVAIADASHNSTLIHMMASVYDLTKRGVFYNRDFLRAVDDNGAMLLEQHLAIGKAIVGGDPEAAAAAARAHLDFVEQSFRVGQEKIKREAIAKKRHSLSASG
ncbi:FadR/GntR family transcriptional regulator [Denitrobaculum tricleocarpae]|uniref:Pyruvate dehydrogenase complex repressor n=1 Tax=Denitrobaculum tricleocarpae TaxID=2591009 RepID=A0A545U2U9_9PROT|nr:FadR/GntR family transcriptional regulator [Denitrobaculum tricleocarpae]TQV83800.1 FadR family transcriptional regulator [Denitrobaculum tricleocarpae]